MMVNFGPEAAAASLALMKQLRAKGVSVELYPDAAKIKKQMAYANALNVPYVAMVGDEEMAQGKLTLKNMATGEQQMVTADEAATIVGAKA